MLTLRLLGHPQISQNGQPIPDYPAAKSQALLFYLACRGRIQSRLALSGLLWPGRNDQEARMNLRQALYQLRQTFPQLLETSRENIALHPQAILEVDALLFGQDSHIGLGGDYARLAAAAERYHGDFLEGFYLEDAPDFEEWMLLERERWRGLAVQTFHQLAIHHTNRGEVGPGVVYVGRLLALEPLREESHQQMMRLLAADGQISAALAQYERCRHLLADALRVEPAPETVALYHAIKNGAIGGSRPQPLELLRAAYPVVPHNLPAPATPFIGRERELKVLFHAFHEASARLVTIVGTGGMGKTRLSLEFAARCRDHHAELYPDGVFFVPLANVVPIPELPITNQISLEIARSLKLTLDNTDSPKNLLLDYIAPRRTLLVLDNFEHLLSGYLLLTELLRAAPGLKLLVTSRERLNLYEEQVFTLQGLTLPPPMSSPQEISPVVSEAVELFMNAARRVQHSFDPGPEAWPSLLLLCQLLDGLPLALELAAAWVDSLSLDEILHELRHDLGLLNARFNDMADRHQSLSQVFDYAWQRLTPEAQKMLVAFTIFRGGFTRAAAAAVSGQSVAPTLLASLVHKSLLARDGNHDHYTIHELVKRFVVEKVGDSFSGEPDVAQRHSAYYCRLLQQLEADLAGAGQERALLEMEMNLENIRAAWQWAVARREISHIAAALSPLFHLYDTRSRFLEGEQFFRDAALRLSWETTEPLERLTLARLQARQGWFTFHLGQHKESLRLLQQSLTALRELGHGTEIAFCLNYLGAIMRHQGRYEEATAYLEEALRIAQAAGDDYAASIGYNTLGQTAYVQGDLDQARHYCQAGLRLKRAMGEKRGMIYSLTYLGRVAQAQGDYVEAQRLFNESLAISNGILDRRGMAIAWQNLGDVALLLQDDAAATTGYERALTLYRAIGDRLGRGRCLLRQGELFMKQEDWLAAAASLREGLEVALAIHSEPVLLDGILALAQVWLQMGQPQRAWVVLDFVTQLPQKQMVRPQMVAQLRQALLALAPTLSTTPPEITDLDTFVQEWVLGQMGSIVGD